MPVNTILGMFAKSPIKPLEEHIKKICDTTHRLVPYFDAVFQQDWKLARTLQLEISQLERDADVLKREIRMTLPRGLFMPVERTDLLEMVTHQDKIANKAKDIAGRILGRELSIPPSMQQAFMAYLARCNDAVDHAAKAINELDDLLETGFGGRELTLVEKMIEELDAIEEDTDVLQVALRRQLLALEADLNPVDVVFLYSIIEWVGDLADLAERVGSRLELMLARS